MIRQSAPLAGVARAGVTALVLALAATSATARDEADALAQGLIRLRSEVEQLNGELELLREEQRVTLAGLAAQRAELAASAERQQLAVREARGKLDAQREALAGASLSGEALLPLLLAATQSLVEQVRAGLPFKIEERLAELEAFRIQIENGSLPPQRAVNRLWAFYEDEFRLTRENGLHAQTITLGDERVLADVAKLGSVALYFRTQDGRLGQAQRGARGWVFTQSEDAAVNKRIAILFDALSKQIRQGYFELPMLAGGAP